MYVYVLALNFLGGTEDTIYAVFDWSVDVK
jgi:hypothetical protein